MDNIKKFVKKKNNIVIFFMGLIVILLQYWSVIGNQVYNLDSVYRIYTSVEPNSHLSQGRIIREFFDNIIGVGMMRTIPTVLITYIIFFILMLAITKLFDVKKNSTKLLTLLIIITFPIINYYFAYGNDIIYYSLGLVFATFSILQLDQKKYKYAILGIILALSTYQLIMSFITTLYILIQLKKSLEGNFNLKEFFKGCLVIILGGIAYLAIWKILLALTAVEISSYQSANTRSALDLLEHIPSKLMFAYKNIFMFTAGKFYYNVNIIGVLACIYSAATFIIIPFVETKREAKNTQYCIIMMLLPIFIFSSSFMIGSTISRSVFQILLLFIFPVLYYIESDRKSLSKIGLVLATLVITYGFLFNQAMFITIKNHGQADSILTKNIYNELTSFEQFNGQSQVGFCGAYNLNSEFELKVSFPYIIRDIYLINGPSIFFNIEDEMNEMRENAYVMRLESVFQRNEININVVKTDCFGSTEGQVYYPQNGYVSYLGDNKFEVFLGPKDKNRTFVHNV